MSFDGVFTLHSMDAGAAIREYLGADAPVADLPAMGYGAVASEYATTHSAESVGIIGGYVGIETGEAFAEHGLDVHLFEIVPHTLQPFGAEAAATVEDHLRKQGIDLHLDTAVEGIDGAGSVERIGTGDDTVPVDLALVGVGVAPNTELAEAAGIELGTTGAIANDRYGQTNDDQVYAARDCAEATHTVTGEPDHVPLALTANRAGRAIGATLAGDPTPVGEIAGTAVVKAFDLEVARTGVIDEESAAEAGFDPVSVTITAQSRAHYYPGGEEIQITLVADRESESVLGASMVGREGVAKRIDTVAAALHAEMTVHQLSYLDLAYAPSFSPVWDPVLTATKVLHGKVAG